MAEMKYKFTKLCECGGKLKIVSPASNLLNFPIECMVCKEHYWTMCWLNWEGGWTEIDKKYGEINEPI